MKTVIIKSALTLSLLALVLLTTACNTTKGAGKDIEAAGAGIKNSADRNGAK
jgi:predicted small secreted protein